MEDILESFGEFEGDEVLNENRHHLEPEELTRLFSVLKSSSRNYWHPFFFIMYQFGCRVSETRIIKKEAISLSRREMVIYRLKKRQWDKHSGLTHQEYCKMVKRVWPEADYTHDNSYIVGGSVVAEWDDSGNKTKAKIKNKSKGFKRFLYKIDDNLLEAINSIQHYNKVKGLEDNNFLFPALRKRVSKKKQDRMVNIGRLKGSHSISRTACWRAFREACERADIPKTLRKDHVLRHTRATLLLADGAPEEQVQYLLGHESITTTRQYIGLANALRAKYQTELSGEFGKTLLG